MIQRALASSAQYLGRQGSPCQSACQALLSALERSHNIGRGSGRCRTFATPAEEYDLIAAEQSLARIDGYAEGGFVVNNNDMHGSIMCLGPLCTTWKVARLEDITLDSLALLDVVKPAPELLVLGCGRTLQRLPSALVEALFAKGIGVEVSDTPNAVATFNILNQEGRAVAAAMLPLGEPT